MLSAARILEGNGLRLARDNTSKYMVEARRTLGAVVATIINHRMRLIS